MHILPEIWIRPWRLGSEKSHQTESWGTTKPIPLNMESTTFKSLITQRVKDALENFETNRNVGSRQGGGTGGDSTQDGNEGHTMNCNYKEFMNFKLKPFYGNEGVIGLSCWIKKMEAVFKISLYAEDFKLDLLPIASRIQHYHGELPMRKSWVLA